MNWWGKLLGGTFGFMIAGPAGAFLGTVFGHNVDRLSELWRFRGEPAEGQAEHAFFTATFSVMGHLAKMDGRVSENEIATAEAIIVQLRLTPDLRRTAIQLFQDGKRLDFQLDSVLDELRYRCAYRVDLIYRFVEIQLNTAYADGTPPADKRNRLHYICDRLGFPRRQFEAMDAYLRNRHRYQRAWRDGPRESKPEHLSTGAQLTAAYAALGLNPQASDTEVKLAYRRLINRYHPDKLAAKGLPKAAMEKANDRTRQVKEAYERIKRARGMAK